MLQMKVIILFSAILFFSCVNSIVWDYNLRNPNLWPYLEGASNECGSGLQSPINIKKEDVTCETSRKLLRPLELSEYDKDVKFNFTNNALTILATVQDESAAYLYRGSGFPLNLAPFELAQFHFHWGQHKFEGSEHTFESKYSPLELHLVHVSTKDPKYFAVIGILFEISLNRNADLEGIIRAADYLATHANSSYLETVNIAKLLPANKDRFYYYEGSLTTPPCLERVFWTVMADKMPISEDQLKHIQENPSKINYRPTQPLNDRYVKTIACELAGEINSAKSIKSSILLILISAILYFF